MSDKLTRKEIREPDRFVQVTSKLWSMLLEHRKVVGLSVLGLVAALLVVALVTRHFEGQAADSRAALGRALEIARQGVEGSTDPALDPDAPKFKSTAEKSEAIAKKLEEVRGQHPGSRAALSATLALADAQFQLGKLDEAAKLYQEYLGATSKEDPFRPLALEGLGYVFESRQEWPKAMESFEQMKKDSSGDTFRARAAFHYARILQQSGKKQEAADAFRKLQDEFKGTSSAQEAGERLGLLAAQGIFPSPAKAVVETPAEGRSPNPGTSSTTTPVVSPVASKEESPREATVNP